MSIRQLPWWFCTGWWSPWCLIDAVVRCKVPWVCKRHDDAQIRWFEDRYGKPIETTTASAFTVTSSTIPINLAWTSSTSTAFTFKPGT